MAGRRVLITGVGSFLGSSLARRLEQDPAFEYIAGLDTRPPSEELGRTELIRADIRDPEMAAIIPATGVDTVVHNQIVRRSGPGMSDRTMHDVNVIGSLQLLTACEKTPHLRNIVVRGSAGIYGAEPGAPQFLDEGVARAAPMRTRFQRDVSEIEKLFAAYAGRHPAVVCTMLRYQPAIGPSLDTQVTRYLSLPVAPTYLGFDPRLQLVHVEDALEALVAAVRRPVRGAVNVASPGTIGLTRMLRLAGRVSLPLAAPLFGPVTRAMQRAGLPQLSPDFTRLLRYGRAVDTTRLVRDVGFSPSFTTVSAVEDYVGRREPAGASPAPAGAGA